MLTLCSRVFQAAAIPLSTFLAAPSLLSSTHSDNGSPSRNNAANLDHLVILPGTASLNMTEAICKEIGVKVGDITTKRFSDGEVYCLINDPIRGKDVFIVQSCAGKPCFR